MARRPAEFVKVGRNDPCPCGSGLNNFRELHRVVE
ncbi:MAG: SEC-C domain-containing protein [Clostridiales bacterium]|nr:SEC-C domain-containing protein [Clostridiales bacterium]